MTPQKQLNEALIIAFNNILSNGILVIEYAGNIITENSQNLFSSRTYQPLNKASLELGDFIDDFKDQVNNVKSHTIKIRKDMVQFCGNNLANKPRCENIVKRLKLDNYQSPSSEWDDFSTMTENIYNNFNMTPELFISWKEHFWIANNKNINFTITQPITANMYDKRRNKFKGKVTLNVGMEYFFSEKLTIDGKFYVLIHEASRKRNKWAIALQDALTIKILSKEEN